jgi:glycine/D-amino acid oxidase-like deaminating enzyme
MKKQEVLIVGGGLAGICIAIHCIDKGHSVTLIDKGHNRSSVVAAGMINPLVFRRMTKSWRVDDFIPFAENFYHTLEQRTANTFFHPITIRRCIASEQERGFWEDRMKDDAFQAYVHPFDEEDNRVDSAFRPHGTGRVKHTAYVDAEVFMTACKALITQHGEYIKATFDYGNFDAETVSYGNKTYDTAIFCEGSESVNNPLFSKLPVEATKGEILTIKSHTLPENESLNRKCFCLPVGEKTFRVGATYVWNTNNDLPTEEGKQVLVSNLRFLTEEKVEVLEHRAGVRPTTLDRRPIMGAHLEFPNVYIFNGLGAKGYLMGPLLAKELVDHIFDGKALDREVGLGRFF